MKSLLKTLIWIFISSVFLQNLCIFSSFAKSENAINIESSAPSLFKERLISPIPLSHNESNVPVAKDVQITKVECEKLCSSKNCQEQAWGKCFEARGNCPSSLIIMQCGNCRSLTPDLVKNCVDIYINGKPN